MWFWFRQDEMVRAEFNGTKGNEFSQGKAVGGKKEKGRSRGERRPAGAARMTGMQLTATAAVARSPWVPPGMTRWSGGSPVSSMESAGSIAPTYMRSSI